MNVSIIVLRQHRGLLALLLGLAISAWYFVLNMGAPLGDAQMAPPVVDAITFIAIWIVMMVAMMLPAATPMVLTFAALQARKHAAGHTRTTAFVLGYLTVWSATGIAAYTLAVAFAVLTAATTGLVDVAPRIAGSFIVAAGIYQLTPLKRMCLAACRSPLGFLIGEWREGVFGAFQVGVKHGVFCLGCCALLFAAIIPLGMMNVVLMAAVAVLVSLEKMFPGRDGVALVSAAVLITGGVLVMIMPTLLPALAPMSSTGASR